MAHLYLVDSTQRLIAGHTVALIDDEARHAAKAARLRVGERVSLGDGRGVTALAEATSVSPERVELVVLDTEHADGWAPELWLVQSLAKGGRDEQAIEQATEIGVDSVVPLAAARSVVRWDADKASKGQARWQKIVTEATKQSLQPRIPIVHPVVTVAEFLESAASVQLIALDHRSEHNILDVSIDPLEGAAPIAVLVGPEGGWSDEERDALTHSGSAWVNLGPGVLRASSAGPIALALVHARLRHW